uniref:Uncharacterized protein n=1 Tax=Setaria italica TaxID=4555 RepID=K3XTQ9_SETIT
MRRRRAGVPSPPHPIRRGRFDFPWRSSSRPPLSVHRLRAAKGKRRATAAVGDAGGEPEPVGGQPEPKPARNFLPCPVVSAARDDRVRAENGTRLLLGSGERS